MDRRLHPVANTDVHAPIAAPLWDAVTRPLAAWTAWPALTGMGTATVANSPVARSLLGPIANLDHAIAAPSIEVGEDKDAVTIKAEIPGLGPDDIELTYDDGVLTIAGEKFYDSGLPGDDASSTATDKSAESDGAQKSADDKSADDTGPTVQLRERSYGRFMRQIPVGRGIDANNIDASYDDGVLTVTLPKTEQAGQTEIPVRKAA